MVFGEQKGRATWAICAAPVKRKVVLCVGSCKDVYFDGHAAAAAARQGFAPGRAI